MIFLPSAKFLYKPKTVAAWTPLSLPLYGWYKADAGTGVSTDGAAVAIWADQSINNNNLAQATAANQGVFRTGANGVNGLPVLEFPASSTVHRYFQDTLFPGGTATGFSFYIISRNPAYNAAAQYTGAFGIGDLAQGSIHQLCNHPVNPTRQQIRISGSTGNDFGEGVISTNYVVTKVSRGATQNSTKTKTTFTSLQNQIATTNNALQNGFNIGRNYIGSVGSKIAEVIVCNRELTGDEEIKLNTYLRSRYGFDLNYGADLPVASPALWLDASRSDTLFTDNLLTTAATTDNGPVGGWKDLSGNNRHALQTFTNRPTWRTPINGLNGLGAMSFNGVSQWLDIASFPSLASGYTFYAVLRANGSSVPFSTANAGTAASTAVINVNTSNVGLSQWGALVSGAATTGLVAGFIGNYDGSHTTGNFFVRTSQSTANTTGTMTQNAGTPAAGTAAVGRATNGTLYFNSQIYELVVLPRQSTTTEDQAWKTYTAAKWGITWS
jgi:hypothetical protein